MWIKHSLQLWTWLCWLATFCHCHAILLSCSTPLFWLLWKCYSLESYVELSGGGGGSTKKYFKVPVSSIPPYMLTVWWARKEAEMDLIWFTTWLSLGRDRGGTRITWITNAWLRYSWLVLMLMISQRSCAKHRIAIFTQDYQSKTVSLKWTYFCLQMHSLNVLNAVNVLREAELASCG